MKKCILCKSNVKHINFNYPSYNHSWQCHNCQFKIWLFDEEINCVDIPTKLKENGQKIILGIFKNDNNIYMHYLYRRDYFTNKKKLSIEANSIDYDYIINLNRKIDKLLIFY